MSNSSGKPLLLINAQRFGKLVELIGKRLPLRELFAYDQKLDIRAHSGDRRRCTYEFFLSFCWSHLPNAGDDDAGSHSKHRSRRIAFDRLETFRVDPVGYRVQALVR